MDKVALRQRLGDIIREEEHTEADWVAVERMCEKLFQDVDAQRNLDCPHIVLHFLSDYDIRAKDADYGRGQRVEIKRFVETGDCNDSKPISGWGCVMALAVGGASLFWLFS
jgi:hypothetical protein